MKDNNPTLQGRFMICLVLSENNGTTVTRLVHTGGNIHECSVNVKHEGSLTLKSDQRLRRVILATHGMNDDYFVKKWGGKEQNRHKGSHVYGRWTTPYNNPRISPKEWVPDEAFINKKKQIFNTIMG